MRFDAPKDRTPAGDADDALAFICHSSGDKERVRELYQQLTRDLGETLYQRLDAPATPEQKHLMAQLSPQQVTATELAGEKITGMLTTAPGDDAPIGGLKVMTANGWFAARPSGTEDVYKIYAESFHGEDHLHRLIDDAQALIDKALTAVPQQHVGGSH